VRRVYNQSKRMAQKRKVPDGIATELRRIVGTVSVGLGEVPMAT